MKNFTQPMQQIAQVLNQVQSMAAARSVCLNSWKRTKKSRPQSIRYSWQMSGAAWISNTFPSAISRNSASSTISAPRCIRDRKLPLLVLPVPEKTTMVKLLMRFYDVNSGSIKLDGHDVRDFDRHQLRESFGMVLQDTWLFQGTIMENIRYGRLDATDEEVIAAAKAAHADTFIRQLPDGYQMELNEDASNVSQGQKQLLTIARAILADNRVMILDEATSSVDTRTEILIQKAMDHLMEGRTSFIIAHRLSTIRNADMILVMKDGDIIEQVRTMSCWRRTVLCGSVPLSVRSDGITAFQKNNSITRKLVFLTPPSLRNTSSKEEAKWRKTICVFLHKKGLPNEKDCAIMMISVVLSAGGERRNTPQRRLHPMGRAVSHYTLRRTSMATTNTQAVPLRTKRGISAGSIFSAIGRWIVRNRIYLIAFAIPAALTYLAYAIFGLYPFGEESVLCLDLNGQYVYYFEALRDAFWGDGSIFYNWSRNLSGEFMGIIGYYLASPFTLIVMLLPEKFMLSSLLIMQLCKVGAAGVTFNYFLQKRRNVQPYPSLLFSTMYSMMAYMVIQLIDPMWLDGLVFLPLIMLGIEYLVDDGRRLNYIIPLALMCVANFYIGYMICIFVALYFFFYLLAGSDKKRKGYDYFTAIVRVAYSSVIALACAAFMLLPVYNALKLGKFEFTDPDYSFRFQSFPLSQKLLENAQDSPLLVLLCDLLDMFPQLLPAQYDSVNVQGKPEIYCGLLTLVLLPLFYMNKKIKLEEKAGLYSADRCDGNVYAHHTGGHDVARRTGAELAAVPLFVLAVLYLPHHGATAFANKDGIQKKHLLGSTGVMVVIIAIVAGLKFDQMAKGAVWISAALMGIYLILLYFMIGGKLTEGKRGVSIALTTMMLVMVGGEATYNAVDSMKDIDDEVAYSTRASYQNYVQNGRAAADMLEEKDDGFYRAEKTFFRCVNDNAAFGLKGISHSSSVMNTGSSTSLRPWAIVCTATTPVMTATQRSLTLCWASSMYWIVVKTSTRTAV